MGQRHQPSHLKKKSPGKATLVSLLLILKTKEYSDSTSGVFDESVKEKLSFLSIQQIFLEHLQSV